MWGGKFVGVRVALADAPAAAVKQLLQQAWEHKAPKSLRKLHADPADLSLGRRTRASATT
jgi:hypothetical protein